MTYQPILSHALKSSSVASSNTTTQILNLRTGILAAVAVVASLAFTAGHAFAETVNVKISTSQQVRAGDSINGWNGGSKARACALAKRNWQLSASRQILRKAQVRSGKTNPRPVSRISPDRARLACRCFKKGFKTKCYVTAHASRWYRWAKGGPGKKWIRGFNVGTVSGVASDRRPSVARKKAYAQYIRNARAKLLAKARRTTRSYRLRVLVNTITPKRASLRAVCWNKGFRRKCRYSEANVSGRVANF